MVGADFASDLGPIEIGFAVKMLIAGATGQRSHGSHPKVIAVRAHGMDGLFEGNLDFETDAIKRDDFQGVEGKVGGKKNPAAAVRVNDGNEPHQATDGAPEQIYAAIA
jgi:hypothetical protein